MRSLLLTIILCSLGLVCLSGNYVTKDVTGNVFTITPGKKLLHTLGWPNDIINSVVIKTSKGIILVDTQNSPANAKLIKAGIEEKLNDSTFVYIINTHGHSCHSGGNCVFAKNTIVAQTNSLGEIKDYDDLFLGQTVEFLRKKIYYKSFILDTIKTEGALSDSIKQAIDLYKFYENDLLTNFKVRYPDLTFEDTLTLHAGNETVKLTYMGKGHGDADVTAYIPEEKVICTGNLFHLGSYKDEGMPSFYLNRINEIDKWIKSLNYILKESNPIEYVLTTHGKHPLERKNLEFARDYCMKVKELVHAAKQNNQSMESLQKIDAFRPLFEEYRSIVSVNGSVEEMHAKNIAMIWKYID
ncbi:MAG TPA: MBL fold metallo-hydrolase [Prolixibacteraceae bacterium]|nr:MBL fold metallo-hydrolase [Prolixibacteraceae bacterium]